MPRFYCPGTLTVGAVQDLPATAAHHVQVLRLATGDPVTLFNGDGGEHAASIVEVSRKSVAVRVDAFLIREAELPYAITLAQALPEASKMDWIIEKAVELGVSAVQPLAAQRCVVRLSGDRAGKRGLHWQAIAVSASEQCGRNRVMTVAAITDFPLFLTAGDGAEARRGAVSGPDRARKIILAPGAPQALADWAREAGRQPVCLLIGPEGGFTAAETTLAESRGALALGMGPRVLRTETAGLAAVAMLTGIWGESQQPGNGR